MTHANAAYTLGIIRKRYKCSHVLYIGTHVHFRQGTVADLY